MTNDSLPKNFRVSLEDVKFLGAGLSRPESVLSFRSGDLFVSHRPGGVTRISRGRAVDVITAGEDIVPNGIARLADGSFLLANHRDAGGVYRLAPDKTMRPFLLEVEGTRLPSVNFVYRDHQGRIWLCISSPRPGDDQYRHNVNDGYIVVYQGGVARVVAEGLCWTNECRLDSAGETNEPPRRQFKRP